LDQRNATQERGRDVWISLKERRFWTITGRTERNGPLPTSNQTHLKKKEKKKKDHQPQEEKADNKNTKEVRKGS